MPTSPRFIKLAADPALGRRSDADISVGRVNVLLGVNGSGKTRILKSFEEGAATSGFKHVRPIRGTRFAQMPLKPQARHHKAIEPSHPLSERVQLILERLSHDDRTVFDGFRDASLRYERGADGPEPMRPESRIGLLFGAVKQALPHLTLHVDHAGVLKAKRTGAAYGLESMSNGEKWIFLLLADLLFGVPSGKTQLIIVDEPELSLHPALARRFWSTVETRLPEATFVYATHSADFALRPGVDRLFHVDAGALSPLTHIQNLPNRIAQELLGGETLSPVSILFCEGGPNGRDQQVLEWLLGVDSRLKIIPVGKHSDVLRYARMSDGISGLPGVRKVWGFVDRDAYNEKAIRSFEKSVTVSPVNEIESMLAHPRVFSALRGVEMADSERRLLEVAAELVPVAVSNHVTAVKGKSGTPTHGKELVAVTTRVNKAVDERNVAQVLAMFPGKELVARMYGCSEEDIGDYVQKLTQDDALREVEPFQSLVAALRRATGVPAGTTA